MKPDEVTQQQLYHMAQANARAVGADICIVICGSTQQPHEARDERGPRSDFVSGVFVNNHRADLSTMVMGCNQVAGEITKKFSNGVLTLIVRGPDGDEPACKGVVVDRFEVTEGPMPGG